MAYSTSDNFPYASLDRWLTTEPDYTAYETPECGDFYALDRCHDCEQTKQVCANCHRCFACEAKMNDEEARADDPCNE